MLGANPLTYQLGPEPTWSNNSVEMKCDTTDSADMATAEAIATVDVVTVAHFGTATTVCVRDSYCTSQPQPLLTDVTALFT